MGIRMKAENLLLRAACGCRGLLLAGQDLLSLRPAAFRRRPGQNTVEYLLMLAVVASMAVIMVILFHKKLLGGIFTLAGLIIGAGKPSN